MDVHAHAYTHEHVHTSTHTCTHVHERAHICTHIHTHMHVSVHTYTRAHISAGIHTYAHHVMHTRTHHVRPLGSFMRWGFFFGRMSSDRKSQQHPFPPVKMYGNTHLAKFFFIFFSLIISELRIIFTCGVTCRVTFCFFSHYTIRTPNEVTQIWQATHMGMNNKTFSLVSVCDSTSESNEGTE
jgi:hypothetical protein